MVPDDSVERALAQSRILDAFLAGTRPAGRLWVAFSGGVDSTVLLHALRAVPGSVAIHINHGLDAAAREWVRHCATVAREFGVRLESQSVCVDAHGNREQAARSARYAALRELLAAGDLLVLGHHADDQAETRVWQLLTGREPGGMPTERRLGVGWLVRPLMGVKRGQILDYARRHSLRWIEDPANADPGFDRNRIRHGILDRLEERHPGALERLSAPRRSAVENLRPLPVEIPPLEILVVCEHAGSADPLKAAHPREPVPHLPDRDGMVAMMCLDVAPRQIGYRRLVSEALLLQH